ncbi:hypothetical protein J7M07_04225 [bacterium]|nr:hypothetical protein [bacterium]
MKKLVKELLWVKEQINVLKERETRLKEQIIAELEKKGKDTIVLEGIGAVVRKSYIQHRFASRKFKEDYPELYEKYLEERPVNGIWSYDWEGWLKAQEKAKGGSEGE